MKKIYIFIALFSIFSVANAQVLFQDAKGNSSIIYPGGTIGINIIESEISFSYSNFGKNDKNGIVYGFDIKGSNASGIANLFDAGKLVPKANLNGFIGLTISNFFWTVSNDTIKNTKNKIKLLGDSINQCSETDEVKIIELKEKQDSLIVKLDEYTNFFNYNRIFFFVKGGINAHEFKLLSNSYDSVNFNNNFNKEYLRGGYWNIGINYLQNPGILFGFSIGGEITDNFENLKNKDYELTEKKTNQTGSQILNQVSKISAYSGNYNNQIMVYNFNFDIIKFLKLSDSNSVAINFYGRLRTVPIDKEEFMKTNFNLGIGSYFFGSTNKFVGGLYIELPDATNENNSDLESLKRLTFGIITKFSFSSIMNPQ